MTAVALAEIADQIRGVSYGKTDVVDRPAEGFLPVLRANNITDNGLSFDDLVYVRAEKVSAKQQVRSGDIVIAASSGSISVVGKAAQAECDLGMGFGAFCKVVRPSPKVHARYIGHFFKTQDYRRKMSALAAGANINNLKNEHINEIEISLPPLDEQKRIAAILDQADELRRKRQRAIDRLGQLGQAIFHDMFGDFEGGNAPVARLSLLTSKIGSGATPKGGDSAYKDEGIPLIRSMNVRDGNFSEKGLAFLDDQQAAKLNNVIVQVNDVLLNITGASVARVCLAPPQMAGARVNQHVSIIRVCQLITSEFLEAFLLMPRTKRKLLSIAEAGATRQAITKAQIEELEVPVPELARQQEFIERLRLARQSAVAMTSQLTGLEAIFSSLQHRAFRGEL